MAANTLWEQSSEKSSRFMYRPTPSVSTAITKRDMEGATRTIERLAIKSSKDRLEELMSQVDDIDLARILQIELQDLTLDNEHAVVTLQHRSEALENELEDIKRHLWENKRRYDKTVWEMKYFRHEYERVASENHTLAMTAPPSMSSSSSSSTSSSAARPILRPPRPSASTATFTPPSLVPPPPPPLPRPSALVMSSGSDNRKVMSWYIDDNSSTTSCGDGSSTSSFSGRQELLSPTTPRLAGPARHVEPNAIFPRYRQPSTSTPMYRLPSMASLSSATSIPVSEAGTFAITPSLSTAGVSIVQQRRSDRLIYGGSDALWETIAKSRGSDVILEKTICNFLRRGGSPNTAKQTSSTGVVRQGYGLIHATVAIQSLTSLGILLRQGANPNAMSLSHIDNDLVTPCYLAARLGWLPGLDRLVQAGADFTKAYGHGMKNKTALHVAAEHCHTPTVEYLLNVTQGMLSPVTDNEGATVLHYACLSGHMELVAFLARSYPSLLYQGDHQGELPLHWAARDGRLEVVVVLVEEFGCDINFHVPPKVGTVLDVAKSSGHKKLADYIKRSGGLSRKKLEKKRDVKVAKDPPSKHMASALARHGFLDF